MGFDFAEFDEAKDRPGLRVAVVGGVPSPWSESVKGFLHIKGVDWTAFRMDLANPEMRDWIGGRSAPALRIDDAPPLTGWVEILLALERRYPEPRLLPETPAERATALGFSHELVGEDGLAWSRRLQMIHGGLTGQGGFSEPVSQYLAPKYGYDELTGAGAKPRVIALLDFFSNRLEAQAEAGSDYLIGDGLTAPDVYLTAVMALLVPLPEEICAMRPSTRAAFESVDAETGAAITQTLLSHRDRMFERHLVTPLSL